MHAFWIPAETTDQFIDKDIDTKLVTSPEKDQIQNWNFKSTSLPTEWP